MIARIRKAKEEDQGFTLVELLVVMIIIGILAAIAIPVFLNQRKAAVDTGMKSDLRSAANEVETFYVNTQDYPTVALFGSDVLPDVEHDQNTTLTYSVDTTAGSYCIQASNNNGTQDWFYKSAAGGLQDESVTSCS